MAVSSLHVGSSERPEVVDIEALLLSQSSDGVLAFDLTGRLCYANPAVYEMLGREPGSVESVFDVLHPDDLDRVGKSIVGVNHGVRPRSGLIRVRARDGEWHQVEVRPFPVRGLDGEVVLTGAVVRDIGLTDAHWAFLARVAAGDPLDVCFEGLAVGLSSETDGPLSIVFTDDGGLRRTVGPVPPDLALHHRDLHHAGLEECPNGEQFPGEPWMTATSGAPAFIAVGDLVEPYASAARRIGAAACVVVAVPDPGSVSPVLIVQWPPNLAMAQILAEALTRRPREAVSLALERRSTQRRLEHMAHHDPLTGVLNRARFGVELRLLARKGPIGVCYIDLDEFKPVNDTFGHDLGDRVLTECARRIEEVAGSDALVTRIGGDEFAVAMRADDPGPLEELAARLVTALAAPIDLGERSVVVGASVGCATASAASEPSDVVAAADRALYEAKRNGGGTWSRASEPLPFDPGPV